MVEGTADRTGTSFRQLFCHQSGLSGQKRLIAFCISPIPACQLLQGGFCLPHLFLPLLNRLFPFRKLLCQAKQPLLLTLQPLQTEFQRIGFSGCAFQPLLFLFQRFQLLLQALKLLLRLIPALSGLCLPPGGFFLLCPRLFALFKQRKVVLQFHKFLLQAGETGVIPFPFFLRFPDGGLGIFLKKGQRFFPLLLPLLARVQLLFSLLKIPLCRLRLFSLLCEGQPLFQFLLLFLPGKKKRESLPLLLQKSNLPIGFLRLPQFFLQRTFCLLLLLFLQRHVLKGLFLL